MHSVRTIFALVLASSLVAIAACGDDDASDEEIVKGTGGGGGDSGGALDTGVVKPDDASSGGDATPIDGGTGCFSFTSDAQGFILGGTAQHQAGQGLVLSLAPGATATATRAFQATGPIGKSTITIDLASQRDTGIWGGNATDVVGVFAQHYGPLATETSAPTSRLFMTGNAFELNQWHAANQLEGNHALSATALGTATSKITIATTWAEQGKVDVTIDNVNRTVSAKTLSTAAGNTLSVVLGGKSAGNVPSYTFTITKVCVDLQP